MAAPSNSRTTSRRLFLASGSAATVFGSLAVAEPVSDAPLSALGRKLDALLPPYRLIVSKVESAPYGTPDDNARFYAAQEEITDLCEEIAELPATSAAGLRVKAQALAFLYPEGFDALFAESPTLDERLALSILNGVTSLLVFKEFRS
jgi:hypothetical protein